MPSLEKKIYRRLRQVYDYVKFERSYSEQKFIKEQEKKFKSLNLNRKKGLFLFSKILSEYPFLNSNMNSEHSIVFCSLSLSRYKINNILEIGTYDATNSFLLSELFPKSKIDTYDLKHTDKNFKSTYHRNNKKKLSIFLKKRNLLLKKKKNINFYELNSLHLSLETNKKYDLIWIDGAHDNPFVAIDLSNSLRLINKNGLIMNDDIIFDARNYDQYYSKASILALQCFQDAKLLDFKLIYKRLSKKNNSIPNLRKYVAIVKKI